jgi:hypothetical protein
VSAIGLDPSSYYPPCSRYHLAKLSSNSPHDVGAPMIGTNDEWAIARRYMDLGLVAGITDTLNVRLPAVTT